jgi:hypothetical protein
MAKSRLPESGGPSTVYPLSLFRVAAGKRVIARMLSVEVRGLFTHYVRGRSLYCHGEACPLAVHRGEAFWKGYLAVELWDKACEHWLPACLEVTEKLELDFRDRYSRGQLWELWRDKETGGKRSPVHGTILEERDPKGFPPAFDVLAVLRTIYHATEIELNAVNPLPKVPQVSPSAGAGPLPLRDGSNQSGFDPEAARLLRERMANIGFGGKEQANGQAR